MRQLPIILFTLPFSLFGQSYDSLITLGYSAYRAGEYLKSGEYFEEAFSLNDNSTSRHYYKAACSYSLAA